MNEFLFQFDGGPSIEYMEELVRRTRELSPDAAEIMDELVEAFTISVEELKVSSEELNQQNLELLSSREALEEERSRFQDLFESAPDGYLVTDPGGIIRQANRSFVELMGISKNGLVGKPLVIYIHPDDRDGFHLNLDRITHGQNMKDKNFEWETHIKSRNNTEIPVAITTAPIRNKKSELTSLRWLVHDLTESKRAARHELLLSKTQARHREAREANRMMLSLIETMPIGAIVANSDGTIPVINTVGREILGSSVIGSLESPQQSFTTHYPDGSPLPPQDMPLARTMKEGKPIKDVEFIIKRADGQERILVASAAPIIDRSKQVTSGITVFQDVTDRRQTRRAMREYANRLHILRSANEAILTASSRDELVESVLPYTHQLLPCQMAGLLIFDPLQEEATSYVSSIEHGSRIQKVINIPFDESWPIQELARGELQIFEDLSNITSRPAWIDALHEEGIRSIVTAPLISKNRLLGTLNLGFEEPFSSDPDQLDSILQMTGKLAIGILQIRQHEELQNYAANLEKKVAQRTRDLRDSELRFRIILDASPFGISLLDTEGRIVATNPAFRTMTGHGVEELTGVSFGNFINLADKKDEHEIYAEMAGGTRTKYEGESQYINNNGEVYWYQITISPIKKPTGDKSWLAVATMEDITEKKKVQETLSRTERLTMAGRLGASLAHEINNPLQSVIGCLGLADEMLADGDEVKHYLDIAMQELERTADIVSQLRDMSRVPGVLSKNPVDVNALIEKALLLTRKRCQTQSIMVKWEPDDGLHQIPLAADRIQQVLLNLILNAVEAMEGGGQLEISTARTSEPDGVCIRIADNGIGIEPNRFPTLFEPFNSNRTEGLGLGLFISRRIINDEHGGHIDVESRPGEGTAFNIHLPG